ncbi:hypothetical protein BC936DRAFT_141642 [Jimgerdemannia flammicorona]|uniref:Uncharacterized protein n=1 Tax=Jimgerdemannia flammicorona TaxID=994334 RepID=A0A433A1W2_9FUNG|nr:hypothetical protein BC936DRAFT_141642 [Jimgerdemannia flammicorona]
MWAVEEFRGVRSNGVMTCNRCKKVLSLFQYGVSGPPLKIHEYGRLFGSGDVVTFRLERSKDLNTLRCYVGINGTKYGEAFGYGTNYDINPVPRILYPVVTLYPQARYRLRTRILHGYMLVSVHQCSGPRRIAMLGNKIQREHSVTTMAQSQPRKYQN